MSARQNIEKKVYSALETKDTGLQQEIKNDLNKMSLDELTELFPEYASQQKEAVSFEIVQDEDPQSPRENDNLGTMYCSHTRYNLGDTDGGAKLIELLSSANLTDQDREALDNASGLKYSSDRKTVALLLETYDVAFVKPLYLYDHSGISISTGSFNDPWDSGQVGLIFLSKEKAKEEGIFGDETWRTQYHAGKSDEEIIGSMLEAEVSEYNDYLTDNVWGYKVSIDGSVQDSGWGYIGDSGKVEAEAEAKGTVDWNIKTGIIISVFEAEQSKLHEVEVYKIASSATGMDIKTLQDAVNAVKAASATASQKL